MAAIKLDLAIYVIVAACLSCYHYPSVPFDPNNVFPSLKPSLSTSSLTHASPERGKTLVYLPGAGFSGFYYTLGVLDASLSSEKEYVCYSAGCLALVTAKLQIPFEEVIAEALGIQSDWKSGKIHRYEVLPRFVDFIVKYARDNSWSDDGMAQVVIATTKFPLRMSLHRPHNVEDLRRQLLATARIPLALSKLTSFEDIDYTDGAFSWFSHSRLQFDEFVLLPLTFELYSNVLAVSVSSDTVRKIYQQGKDSVQQQLGSSVGSGNNNSAEV